MKKMLRGIAVGLCMAATFSLSAAVSADGFENGNGLDISMIARYTSGAVNFDGGVMEIVDYNRDNGFSYAVNGQSGKLAAIKLKDAESAELQGFEIDVKALVETDDFVYGDMTSISVSPDCSMLAVALQDAEYDEEGLIALFSCNSDGSASFLRSFPAGVQPDMVTFSPDGK